jgi:hypothetical protein
VLSTALLIGAGLVIVGDGILALKARLRRRMDRGTISSDDAARARAETLRQLSRDMDKENAARAKLDVLSVFTP